MRHGHHLVEVTEIALKIVVCDPVLSKLDVTLQFVDGTARPAVTLHVLAELLIAQFALILMIAFTLFGVDVVVGRPQLLVRVGIVEVMGFYFVQEVMWQE